MKPLEPPQVTYTTGISSPSPPRLTMEAHQEPSARIGEVTDTSVQTISTPPTIELTQEKITKEEEKQVE